MHPLLLLEFKSVTLSKYLEVRKQEAVFLRAIGTSSDQ